MVLDENGTMLRVTIVRELVVAPYTVPGWDVSDIAATAKVLADAGLKLERYPGIPQVELRIWTPPSGARVVQGSGW